jgi:hypothetical protein
MTFNPEGRPILPGRDGVVLEVASYRPASADAPVALVGVTKEAHQQVIESDPGGPAKGNAGRSSPQNTSVEMAYARPTGQF